MWLSVNDKNVSFINLKHVIKIYEAQCWDGSFVVKTISVNGDENIIFRNPSPEAARKNMQEIWNALKHDQ
jgi:hypothetical protein